MCLKRNHYRKFSVGFLIVKNAEKSAKQKSVLYANKCMYVFVHVHVCVIEFRTVQQLYARSNGKKTKKRQAVLCIPGTSCSQSVCSCVYLSIRKKTDTNYKLSHTLIIAPTRN